MLGVGLGLHGLGLWVVRVGVMVVAGFFGKFINLLKIIGFLKNYYILEKIMDFRYAAGLLR